MWMMTKDGFFSIVQHKDDRTRVLVRARTYDDMARWCERALVSLDEIDAESGTDYPFRVFVDRGVLAGWMVRMTSALDYPNFKSRIGEDDAERASVYSRIWSLLGNALGFAPNRTWERGPVYDTSQLEISTAYDEDVKDDDFEFLFGPEGE